MSGSVLNGWPPFGRARRAAGQGVAEAIQAIAPDSGRNALGQPESGTIACITNARTAQRPMVVRDERAASDAAASCPDQRPEYACKPLKKRLTTVKLNSTVEKPMIASHADREPRQPRVARAWM